jgi:hypothetical protein
MRPIFSGMAGEIFGEDETLDGMFLWHGNYLENVHR